MRPSATRLFALNLREAIIKIIRVYVILALRFALLFLALKL
jgi:hypothetical protein